MVITLLRFGSNFLRFPCGYSASLSPLCVPEAINLPHRFFTMLFFSGFCSVVYSSSSSSARISSYVRSPSSPTLVSSTALSMPNLLLSYLTLPYVHLESPWCAATWSLGYLVTRLPTTVIRSRKRRIAQIATVHLREERSEKFILRFYFNELQISGWKNWQ